MSDLIDRQLVTEHIKKRLYETALNNIEVSAYEEMAANRIDVWINEVPSAEPKMGRWIRGSAYPHHIFCSVCYATYVPNDEWVIWKTDGTDGYRLSRNFCPSCGADMRGEEDEDD